MSWDFLGVWFWFYPGTGGFFALACFFLFSRSTYKQICFKDESFGSTPCLQLSSLFFYCPFRLVLMSEPFGRDFVFF